MLKKYLIMPLIVMLVGNSIMMAADYAGKRDLGVYHIPIYNKDTQKISAMHVYRSADGTYFYTRMHKEFAMKTKFILTCVDNNNRSFAYNKDVINSLKKQIKLYENGILDLI